MLDSDFWKKLEKKFRSIEDCARLHFNWADMPTGGLPERWDFSLPGTALYTPRLRFETLARRAGTKLDPKCVDSLATWLSHLKRVGRTDLVKRFEGVGIGRGQIQCVCVVSADCCLKLESDALEREKFARYEEERKSDPSLYETSATPDAPIEQTLADSDAITAERKNALLAFKAKGRKQRIRVTDEMVAQAANPGKWNDRTMVTRWKRDDSRIELIHDKKIRAVLARNPSDIWPPKPKPQKIKSPQNPQSPH